MRTKHLNELISNIEVAKFNFAKQAAEAFGKDEEQDKQALLAVAQMDNLQGHLQQAIHVRNRSFLLDHLYCEVTLEKLNDKGFNFKMPACEGIKVVIAQVRADKFQHSGAFAAVFVYKTLSYSKYLGQQELAAVQAALDLIENQIEV